MVTCNLALARIIIIDREPRFTVRLGIMELNTAMDPYHLIDATFEVVSSVPCLKKVSQSKLQQFAANLTLVALGIRSVPPFH